jgi:uncharacterized membrane protein YfcA
MSRVSRNTWNWGVKEWAIDYAEFVLHTLTPLVWLILFVGIMDRKTFLETWFMPFLGVFAAFLANCVPLGGGIVYIPVLSLLGANIQLGSAFTIAIMPFGNGVFGFFRWLLKNPSMIRWEVLPYVVLSSWLGSFAAVFMFPPIDSYWIKIGFGFFCLILGFLVLSAVYRGGLRSVFGLPSTSNLPNNSLVIEQKLPEPQDKESDKQQEVDLIGLLDDVETPSGKEEAINQEVDTANVEHDEAADLDDLLMAEYDNAEIDSSSYNDHSDAQDVPVNQRWILVTVGLLGGFIFVPNIGIGPALFTYVTLALLGYEETAAMVTGIITGGWVCALPFVWNVVYFTVPYQLWVMTLPGVYLGAKFAPHAIEYVGVQRVMTAFSIFLFASAALYFLH